MDALTTRGRASVLLICLSLSQASCTRQPGGTTVSDAELARTQAAIASTVKVGSPGPIIPPQPEPDPVPNDDTIECPSCDGMGTDGYVQCTRCDGSGVIPNPRGSGADIAQKLDDLAARIDKLETTVNANIQQIEAVANSAEDSSEFLGWLQQRAEALREEIEKVHWSDPPPFEVETPPGDPNKPHVIHAYHESDGWKKHPWPEAPIGSIGKATNGQWYWKHKDGTFRKR